MFGIFAEDALLFLFSYDMKKLKVDPNEGKCQKFNIVGKDEINNLELAQFIAKVQNKDLIYEMVDFHSSRPGHDLRYALDGSNHDLASCFSGVYFNYEFYRLLGLR